jgi:hypothetical protein
MIEATTQNVTSETTHNFYGLSWHAEIRCQQRGIKNWAVEQILLHGEKIYKQGRTFRYIKRKDIPKKYSPSEFKQLANLMILVSDCNNIITVFKNADGVARVKRKPKRLARYKHLHSDDNNKSFQKGHGNDDTYFRNAA